ncbi:L,D-transpeptidase family protein [Mesorhizobium sp. Z1-4]|uniref:L,D-transpeptidase family protein n=1 Tax=Mesorhizobium sp. Z1-4 TaxID=2448478 RepID=UPI001FE09A9B|nr:L,D-transpeptidase family protein [Mesorhizobium sp. Z1-4]
MRSRPGNRAQGQLIAGNRVMRCALGRSGISANKREGDGATPRASMKVIGGFRRGRRIAVPARLSLRAIRADFGWCDAPADANYNRLVRLPFTASHEKMMRDDRLYDVVIVLDWNIGSRRRNLGSAIFLHVAKPDYAPTEGCVAVSPRDMAWLLAQMGRGSIVKVVG